MRGSRTATLAILLLAVLCFISLPVFSSENPWDADGGSGKGSSSDSTIVPGDTNGNAIIMRAGGNPGTSTGGTDLFTSFMVSMSLQVASWLELYSSPVQTPVRVEASKVKSRQKQVRKFVE